MYRNLQLCNSGLQRGLTWKERVACKSQATGAKLPHLDGVSCSLVGGGYLDF